MSGQGPMVLREMALLADGERGALIGPRGDIGWLCVPRWHDEPVFAGLIHGEGEFTVTPADPWNVWGGYYEPASLVWHSRWVTSTGLIECDEALRYPGELDQVVILRRVRALAGPATVSVVVAPVSGFRGTPVVFAQDGEQWVGSADDLSVRVSGLGAAAEVVDGRLAAELVVAEGDAHDIVLELTRASLPTDPPAPAAAWADTRAAWAAVTPALEGVPSRDEVRRSYAVLAGLTSRDNGMVAAATMSLPERAREGRNYDYRYAWIRDQCYVGQAVAAFGPHPLLTAALTFITDRIIEHGADLRPGYTVSGGPVPQEHHVGLGGYPGGGDTAGNWITGQFQLDIFGEAMSLYAAAAGLDLLEARHWQAARICAQVIADHWDRPEAGIWELADDEYTQSRLVCIAGLQAMARVTDPAEGTHWSVLADTILSATSATSIHPEGYWQQSPSKDRVDASLLLPMVRGALPVDDPRSVATLRAVIEQLTIDGHVYRFRQDDRPLHDAEGSFTLCGFMTALAFQASGDTQAAVHFFERARAACTSSGLFTEEYDTAQHQLRGNLPQAFVHALFIECAARIDAQPRVLTR